MAVGRRLTREDRDLIHSAEYLLRRGYDPLHHTVAAAVRSDSGRIYFGLNVNGIFSPCAEPVAIGAAFTAGEHGIRSMVAVHRRGATYPVISPCGTCRQLLYDYAPRASVIVRFANGRLARLTATEALPGAYATFGDD